MQRAITNVTRLAKIAGFAAAMSAATLPAHADQADAKKLLKAMSDYLTQQTNISFDMDTTLEIVTPQRQKIGLASSGSATISRPDKIHATRKGGFADVEFVFDGKTLSLLNKDAKLYTQADVPGNLDNLVDTVRDKFHRPLPAADLLMSKVYDELMTGVVNVKDLGSGVIRGQECDHLAFRTKEVDWQIWISQGDKPLPCRYTITTRRTPAAPQYTIDFSDWKTGADVMKDDFSFKPPADAKLVKPDEVTDADELPGFVKPQ
jgi:hypothetical protein